MNAAVAVLMPVRGAAPFLAAALHSLRAQTLHDWVCLLCPLDAQAEAAVTAQLGQDTRIVRGLGCADEAEALAQNAATITAPLLCVLDGNDVLHPQALTLLSAALLEHPAAGVSYSRHVLIDANGRVLGPGPLCELPYSPQALLLDFMTGPLRLLRREVLQAAGGFRSEFADAADYDVCLRLSECTEFVHVPQPLYLRRIHPAAPEVARWGEGIEARYAAFVAAVQRRGLDAQYDCALQIDSWHVLQRLQ